MNYIVAGQRPWTRHAFIFDGGPPNSTYVETTEKLVWVMKGPPPRYIFFLHWSERVPKEILDWTECVCFHMTDVPYGRGGSPLQNLIARGHTETMLSALLMTDEIDAGPVYMKRPLSLEGPAHQIYFRAMMLALDMAKEIAKLEIVPAKQEGDVVSFLRRTPNQSRLASILELPQIYNHIRMLDAEGYPRAFLEYGRLRLEFTDAVLTEDALEAKVRITKL